MVKNAELKTYLNIANENKSSWPFCNFQIGQLQKNQHTFEAIKNLCPTDSELECVYGSVMTDLMTWVLFNADIWEGA